MKKSEVTEIVMMLFAAFPSAKGDPEQWQRTLRVYGEMLVDLERDAARKAVMRLIGTAKWLPTIAEIRTAATELELGPVRTGGEAWQEAVAAARHQGRYDVVTFSDPLVTEALRLWGSWQDFCNSPEDDPGGRARFIDLYDSLAARKRQDVSSGIPLPAPKSSPQLMTIPANALRAGQTVRLGAAPAEAPAPTVLVAPPRKPPAPSQYHRRVSVEELDAIINPEPRQASGGTP